MVIRVNNRNSLVGTVLILISVLCLVAAVFFVPWSDIAGLRKQNFVEEVKTEVINEDTSADNIVAASLEEEQYVEEPVSVETELEAEAEHEDLVEEEPVIELIENPYKEYFLKNEDMIAWIEIPDTEVSFPVVWTPFDENYYLYRDFDKKHDAKGLPLLDTDSHMYPSSTNLIIHGHNLKNQRFYFILQYEDEEYLSNHPYIYLYGKDYKHVYEVMTVFRSKVFYQTDTCFKYYKFFDANSEEEFKDFYDNVKKLQLYDTGVTAEYGDKFLTLSTCSDHVENGRFVVVAKEIEPAEYYISFEVPKESMEASLEKGGE